jgi:hypothetical protein
MVERRKPRCNVLISGFPFLLIFFRRRARQHSVWHVVAVVTIISIMLLDRGPSGGQWPVSVGDMSATWVSTQKCPSLGELLEGVMGMFELTNTNELYHLCHGPNRSYHVILPVPIDFLFTVTLWLSKAAALDRARRPRSIPVTKLEVLRNAEKCWQQKSNMPKTHWRSRGKPRKKTIWRRQSKSGKKMGSNMEHHGASFYFKSCWVPVSIIPNHSSDSAAKKGKRANFNHELWMFDECSMINSWLPCDLVWSHVVLCRVVLPLQDRRLGASKLQIRVTLWAPFLDLKKP